RLRPAIRPSAGASGEWHAGRARGRRDAMTIRWLRRPGLDISFGREPKILLLCGVPALLAYVATMMVLGLLGLSDMLGEWQRLQAGALTLQLPADTSAARTEMALAVLRQTPGIASARVIEP